MRVKICGITHPEDAIYAAHAGADFIGIIFSKKSKRTVSIKQAKEIFSSINCCKTELVGIFVEESAEEISTICNEIHIQTIQLHGENAKKQLRYLSHIPTIFYALAHDASPETMSTLPPQAIPLFDHHQAGSGKKFNWNNFIPPQQPWILAGGLNKDNVLEAIQLLKPHIVDVASGVEYPDSSRKDFRLVSDFINNAKKTGGLK